MFSGMTLANWLTLHGLVTVFALLLYVITAHVLQQRRQPAAAIAWIMFIVSLPYLALPAFLVFGSRKLKRPSSTLLQAAPAGTGDSSWAVETIVALGQPRPTDYDELNVHDDGRAARAALLEAIDAARESIDLCTFILARDALGTEVVDRLCARARRGVRVRLLLDGLGRFMARPPSLQPLVAAGGTWRLFVAPLRSPLKGRTNLRNHRKLLVIDATTPAGRLWCGGRNLADEYFEGDPDTPPWRDLSFDLSGPLVRQAAALFEHDWAFAGGQAAAPWPAEAAARPAAGGAQLVASGPDQADDTVYDLLVTAAYRARRRIAIATPYFVPESALLMALCLAARRGVTVDLLLPARSNHRLSDLARGRALRTLAQSGGRIRLAPDMVHAKLVVIDESLALAGSANLDSRSLFLNYELMVAFHNAGDVRRFAAWFDGLLPQARTFSAAPPGLLRDVFEGMLLWVGFQL